MTRSADAQTTPPDPDQARQQRIRQRAAEIRAEDAQAEADEPYGDPKAVQDEGALESLG